MAAAQILIPDVMPSRNANGRALPAVLRFYEPSAAYSVPKTVYTDNSLITPHDVNGVESDAAGIFPAIWADDAETFDAGCYTQDTGRTIRTFANVATTAALALLADIESAEAAATTAASTASTAATTATTKATEAAASAVTAANASTTAEGVAETLGDSLQNAQQIMAFDEAGADLIPVVVDQALGVVIGVDPDTGEVRQRLASTNVQAALGTVDPQSLQYTGDDDLVPLIVDGGIGVILGVRRSTGAVYGRIDADGMVSGLANLLGTALMSWSDPTGDIPLIMDAGNNILLGVNAETGAPVGSLVAQLGGGGAALPGRIASSDAPVLTDWNGFILYGQSLSIGATARPVLSTTQPYSNITFGGGPKALASGSPGMSTTIPLIEDIATPDSTNDRGETWCSSASNWFSSLAMLEAGIAPGDLVQFCSAAGHGAYSITQLDAASAWYQNFLDHVTQAKARATAAGASFAVHAMEWGQGEADIAMARATYLGHFLQLAADVRTDVRLITGQAPPPHVLTYQNGQVGGSQLAQLDAVLQDDLIHLVGPNWFLPHDGDGTHLTNVGEVLLGRYFGRARKQLVLEGRRPDAVLPVSATAVGTTLRVRFRCPTQLVFDTTDLPATTDHGFQVTDGSGTLTLSSLAIGTWSAAPDGWMGFCDVTMTVNRTLAASPVVTYARAYLAASLTRTNGASGNLRDSTADTTTVSGTTYQLAHHAPHFELPILTPLEA